MTCCIHFTNIFLACFCHPSVGKFDVTRKSDPSESFMIDPLNNSNFLQSSLAGILIIHTELMLVQADLDYVSVEN